MELEFIEPLQTSLKVEIIIKVNINTNNSEEFGRGFWIIGYCCTLYSLVGFFARIVWYKGLFIIIIFIIILCI